MGGQACVFYGPAEFSSDTDLAILASSENLAKLDKALTDLDAQVIAVPPFEARYLRKVTRFILGVDTPKLWDGCKHSSPTLDGL